MHRHGLGELCKSIIVSVVLPREALHATIDGLCLFIRQRVTESDSLLMVAVRAMNIPVWFSVALWNIQGDSTGVATDSLYHDS
jgi:hypothetical protein